jgi:hypothetical protein
MIRITITLAACGDRRHAGARNVAVEPERAQASLLCE